MRIRLLFVLLILTATVASSRAELPVEDLILDLDADKDVVVEEADRVVKWSNQVGAFVARDFVKENQGREEPGSGRPTRKRNVTAIGGHDTIVFQRQELVNHHEDAFDHLLTGSGYTWFAVICVHKQVRQLKDVNSFFV